MSQENGVRERAAYLRCVEELRQASRVLGCRGWGPLHDSGFRPKFSCHKTGVPSGRRAPTTTRMMQAWHFLEVALLLSVQTFRVPENMCRIYGSFPKLEVSFWGVSRRRTIVFWRFTLGSPFSKETTILL